MAIIQPPSFSSMLRAQDPFGPGMSTPFQDSLNRDRTLESQLVSAGIGVRGELTGVEEQGRNLLAAARINADSAKDIVKIQAKSNTLAARRQALLNLATGGGGPVRRFAGDALQPAPSGLGGVIGTANGFNNTLAQLGALRQYGSDFSTPTAATQNSLTGVLQAISLPQPFG
jgi:hypothetical protein